MALFRFVKLYRAAAEFIRSDTIPVDQSIVGAVRHSPYHRRIVAAGAVCAVGAAILGTIATFLEGMDRSEGVVTYLSLPLVFGAMGMFFGVSISCLFAPRDFLSSPAGRKWLRLIGTQSVGVARGVCLVLAIIGCALFGLMALSLFR